MKLGQRQIRTKVRQGSRSSAPEQSSHADDCILAAGTFLYTCILNGDFGVI